MFKHYQQNYAGEVSFTVSVNVVSMCINQMAISAAINSLLIKMGTHMLEAANLFSFTFKQGIC